MPGWAKALIIIVVLLILVVVGIAAAGVFWWSRNKDTIIAKGKAHVTEGEAAGRTSDNQGCVDKSIERYKGERGMYGAIGNSIFMHTCLLRSRPTPGFCNDVPKETSFVESGRWRVAQCEHYDLSEDKYCQQLFAPVQKFCERGGSRPERDEPSDIN